MHSVTGVEYQPTHLGEGTPQGKMLTTVGLTSNAGPHGRAPRAGRGVARHGDRRHRTALRRARDPVVGVPRHRHRPDSNITVELFQMSNLDMTPNQEAIDAYFAGHPDAMETLTKLGADATVAAKAAADAAIRACSPS